MALFGKKNSKPSSGVMGKPKNLSFKLKTGVALVPIVSEKSTRLQQSGQYMFKALGVISKIEVKKAIESAYGVRVLGVNSLGLPGKVVRRGRQVGKRKARRHLIVRLAPGETIDTAKVL